MLFAKCSAELMVNTLLGEGFLLSYYQTWMVLICMGTTIFLQIKYLNEVRASRCLACLVAQ